MKIVIVGAGEAGRHLAKTLSGRRHDICLIEQSERLVDELSESLDVHAVVGNGASVITLAEAEAPAADLVIALTDDDNANLVAASLAKALGAKKTIARVHAALQREEWLFDHRKHFGIDYLFSSERLAAVELAKFVRNPEGLLVEEMAKGRIELQQTRIGPTSDVAGKSLRELNLPERIRIGSIQRDDVTIIPSAQDRLEVGDLVTLFGDPARLASIRNEFHRGAREEPPPNVVIFGGDDYGLALAQMLEGRRFRVRILETDKRLCRHLSDVLRDTVVIQGNATSLQQLREEQIGQADFFIAASRNDEDNVMACLQAKTLGTKYCLALIHRADYADIVSQNAEQLRMLGGVSPRIVTSRELARFVTTDPFHVVVKLTGGAEVLEVVVSGTSGVAGRRIRDVAWPAGCVLVALVQGTSARTPTGDDQLETDDLFYAMVSLPAKKQFIKLITP